MRIRSAGLSIAAQRYLGAVVLVTAATVAAAIHQFGPTAHDGVTWLILATCAAAAQFFVVPTGSNHGFHTAIVFTIAAALLLPPELVALMGLAQHLPDGLKKRYPWYIQTFNICNYTLSALAAWGTLRLVAPDAPIGSRRWALAALLASFLFVVVNHALLAVMLRLARRHSFRDSGLFKPDSLATDLTLVALGLAFVVIWHTNPLLAVTAAAPLLLIQRSLQVPALAAQARIDAKTGLFNAAYFSGALEHELTRAARFQRPLSLILADLDLLRNINNTYGHLAGDAVLSGVADVFRAELRDVDVPARFGGEEFAILLPETSIEEALLVAERIRARVAEAPFHSTTTPQPIWATVSIGVASFPAHGTDPNELIHEADVAVYRAKLVGRNRVVEAGDGDSFVPAPDLSLAADTPA
jgi:diguanylate cyclase (GGDEF)-like protein